MHRAVWVVNENLNVPKAKQNRRAASLVLTGRFQTFMCLLADGILQHSVCLLAITWLVLIRGADMRSTEPKDMFKSDQVCSLADSIWSWQSCYENPYKACFIGIGATETPATVWKSHNKNPCSISFFKAVVLHCRCGTDVTCGYLYVCFF